MPTTLSTKALQLSDGRYIPTVVRIASTFSVSSGVGAATSFAPFESYGYLNARLHLHVHDIQANTTLTIQMQTGPTTGAVTENLRTSTGSNWWFVSTTGVHTRTFIGMDRWSQILAHCLGAGTCPAMSIDAELI